jgi:hypothetical protein
MSGTKVIVEPWHDEYILVWGHETFYDEQRHLMTWSTPEAALEWLKENHPELWGC